MELDNGMFIGTDAEQDRLEAEGESTAALSERAVDDAVSFLMTPAGFQESVEEAIGTDADKFAERLADIAFAATAERRWIAVRSLAGYLLTTATNLVCMRTRAYLWLPTARINPTPVQLTRAAEFIDGWMKGECK